MGCSMDYERNLAVSGFHNDLPPHFGSRKIPDLFLAPWMVSNVFFC